MSPKPTIRILHIDDTPESVRAVQHWVKTKPDVGYTIRHPNEVTLEDLLVAQLILVDLKIDHWSERDALKQLTLRPSNGLALATILKEVVEEEGEEMPRAFALFTSEISSISRGLVELPYVLSRAYDLEWIFEKSGGVPEERWNQFLELAQAVASLPNPWPSHSAQETLQSLTNWLRLDSEASWFPMAKDGILRAHPPIHDAARHTHGVALVRWFAHRILPYPAFLFDTIYLAARLCVRVTSLMDSLDTSTPFQEWLASSEYSGAMAGFLGKRWWRAGIESLLFDLCLEDPTNGARLKIELHRMAPELEFLEGGFRFVTLDSSLRATPNLALSHDVDEVAPDDWPPFADLAWATKEDIANNDHLRLLKRG